MGKVQAKITQIEIRCLITAWRQQVEKLWGRAGIAGPMHEGANPIRWAEWEQLTRFLLQDMGLDMFQASEHIELVLEDCASKGDVKPPPPGFFMTSKAWDLRKHRVKEERAQAQSIANTQRATAQRLEHGSADYLRIQLQKIGKLAQQYWNRFNVEACRTQHEAWHQLLIDPGWAKDSLVAAARSGVIIPEFVCCSVSFAELIQNDTQVAQILQPIWTQRSYWREQMQREPTIVEFAWTEFGDELG